MVVTSWRSGSTLMGKLINSYPKSFYTSEPLFLAGIRRVYEGDRLEKASINVMVNFGIRNATKLNFFF